MKTAAALARRMRVLVTPMVLALLIVAGLQAAPGEARSDYLSAYPEDPVCSSVSGKGPHIQVSTNARTLDVVARPLLHAIGDEAGPGPQRIPPSWLGAPVFRLHEPEKPKDTKSGNGLAHSERGIDGRIRLPLRKDGIYLVTVTAGRRQESMILRVTSLEMVVKHTRNEVAGFVFDLKKQRPAAHLPLQIRSDGRLRYEGHTSADGSFAMRSPSPMGHRLTVRVGTFDREAFYQFDDYGAPTQKEAVYLQTDRPVYRPGQKVLFKASLVARGDVCPAQSVSIEIRDPGNRLLQKTNPVSNPAGSVTGSLQLPSEAASGDYNLVTTWKGIRHYDTFKVTEYRKPTFEVVVKATPRRAIQGEPIEAEVTARYYHGQPLADTPVSVRVVATRRQPTFALEGDEEPAERYDGESGEGGERVVLEKTEKLDARGHLKLKIDTEKHDWDATYTIVANVQDSERRAYQGSDTVTVDRSSLAVLAFTEDSFTEKGQPITVSLRCQDSEGRPAPGEVHVTVARETQGLFGSGWTNVKEDTVKVGADGRASWSYTPTETGRHRVEAQVADASGRKTRSAATFYVAGPGEGWRGGQGSTLELVPNRRKLKVGQEAKIILRTALSGGWAYVAVEGDRVHETRVVHLKGSAETIRIPVRAAYSPSLHVHATVFRGGQYASGSIRLSVPRADKKLDVAITSDKSSYAPGEAARYRVRITDSKKRPVRTEFCLAVVDEALFAIEPEKTADPMVFFHGPRDNEVRTGLSVPSEVSGGSYQKVEGREPDVTRPVRKTFKDTVYWGPTLRTGADGTASVTVRLPDNLTRWRATVRAIAPRVRVGLARQRIVARKELMVQLVAPRFLRESDRLELGATVHNQSKQARDVVVSLDAPGLDVGSEGPRTLRIEPGKSAPVRWEAHVRAVPAAEKVVFTVRAQAGPLADAESRGVPVLAYGGRREQHRAAILRGSAPFEEQVTVGRKSGARLVLRVAPDLVASSLGSLEALATFPYGCVEQTMSGFLPDVMLAQVLKEGRIKSPTLARQLPAMVAKGLRRLYDYQHSDGGWGWWHDDPTDARMTAYVVYGLSLAADAGFDVELNCRDRGYRWLVEHASKPKSKAKAGASPTPAPSPTPSAREEAQARELDAFILRACAYHAKSMRSAPPAKGTPFEARLAARLLACRARLSPYSRGLLADGLWRLGKTREAAQVLREASATVQERDGSCHWEPALLSEEWGGNSVETTAILLAMVVRVNPRDSRVAGMVTWLLRQRQGDMWDSTRSSAAALLALARCASSLGSPGAGYAGRVLVNGREVGRFRTSPNTSGQPERVFVMGGAKLQAGGNRVRVERDGPGIMLVSRSLVTYDDGAPQAQDHGLQVIRTYEAEDEHGQWVEATRFKAGQRIRVRLSVTSRGRHQQLLVEDPFPSGFEVENLRVGDDQYWSQREAHDRHMAVFLGWMNAGEKRIITYTGRAERSGTLHVMPARATVVYLPEIFGQSAAHVLEAQP